MFQKVTISFISVRPSLCVEQLTSPRRISVKFYASDFLNKICHENSSSKNRTKIGGILREDLRLLWLRVLPWLPSTVTLNIE